MFKLQTLPPYYPTAGSLLSIKMEGLFPIQTNTQSILIPCPPADGSLAGDDVTLAVIEAKVCLELTDALTRQAINAEVTRVTNTLRLSRPLVHFTFCVLVARLELAGVCLVTWKLRAMDNQLDCYLNQIQHLKVCRIT